MKQKHSAMIGIVGGLIDLVAGLALQPASSMGLMEEPMTVTVSTFWVSYFLLGLGAIVLLTGLYMLTARMTKNRSLFGSLMTVYGTLMLVWGIAMLGRVFSMMQGSTLSGAVMIISGIAMLYSGFDMARKQIPTQR